MDKELWYVVQTNTGSEHDIQTRLNRLNYPTMLPGKVMLERRGGKIQEIIRLMLPGYIFVQTKMRAADWHNIRRLPGVLRILGDGLPTPLNDAECERICWLSNHGRPWGISSGRFENGTLAIDTGPLAGHESEIIRVDARTNRARIHAEILGEGKVIDLGLIIDKQPDEPEG